MYSGRADDPRVEIEALKVRGGGGLRRPHVGRELARVCSLAWGLRMPLRCAGLPRVFSLVVVAVIAAAAGDWLAGTNAARVALGQSALTLPATTMMGALFDFISSAEPKHFQPMPPNFGIIPALPQRVRNKRERYGVYRDRALADLQTWASNHQISLQTPIPVAS